MNTEFILNVWAIIAPIVLLLVILLLVRAEQIKKNKEEGHFIFLYKTGEIDVGKWKWGDIKRRARQETKKITLIEFDQKLKGRFKRDFSCCSELWASTKAVFKE